MSTTTNNAIPNCAEVMGGYKTVQAEEEFSSVSTVSTSGLLLRIPEKITGIRDVKITVKIFITPLDAVTLFSVSIPDPGVVTKTYLNFADTMLTYASTTMGGATKTYATYAYVSGLNAYSVVINNLVLHTTMSGNITAYLTYFSLA